MQPLAPQTSSFISFKENPDIYILGMAESEKSEDFVLKGDDPKIAGAVNHPDFCRYVSGLDFYQQAPPLASKEIDIGIVPSSEYICIRLKGQKGWFNFLHPDANEKPRTTLEKTKLSDAIDEVARAHFLEMREADEKIKKQCKDLDRWKFSSSNEAYSFHYYRQKALEENCLLLEVWEENPFAKETSIFEKMYSSVIHFFKQLLYCLLAVFKVPA
jgi:hypothetical protein